MYKNAGAKVKGLATTITTLLIIVCVLVGMFTMFNGYRGRGVLPGLLIIVFGSFAAWLSGLMLAAFGELVENTYHIRKLLSEGGSVVNAEPVKPAYADVPVTQAEINAVMQRDGVPYADAVMIAKKEKMAGTKTYQVSSNTGEAVCPNCGSPRKNNSAFCGYCGTRLQ